MGDEPNLAWANMLGTAQQEEEEVTILGATPRTIQTSVKVKFEPTDASDKKDPQPTLAKPKPTIKSEKGKPSEPQVVDPTKCVVVCSQVPNKDCTKRPDFHTELDPHALEMGGAILDWFEFWRVVAGATNWYGNVATVWNYQALQNADVRNKIKQDEKSLLLVLTPVGSALFNEAMAMVQAPGVAPHLTLPTILDVAALRRELALLIANLSARHQANFNRNNNRSSRNSNLHLQFNVIEDAITAHLTTLATLSLSFKTRNRKRKLFLVE